MLPFVSWVLVISDIEPGPAVESATLHAADVIGNQIVAQLVALVRAHPKLVRPRTKLDPDRIPDSPGKNVLTGPVRIELENARAIGLGSVVRGVREGADRDIHFF